MGISPTTKAECRRVSTPQGLRGAQRMRIRKSFIGLVAAATAAGTLLLAAPAGAASTCNSGEAPALQGQMSGLKIACTFLAADVGASSTYLDYPNAVWHWGAARVVNVTQAAAGAAITDAHTAAQAAFASPADVNRSVEGGNIPPGDFVKSVSGATVTLAVPTTVRLGFTSVVTAAANGIKAGSSKVTITTAPTKLWTGLTIAGTGIAAGSVIWNVDVVNKVLNLSLPAAASASSVALTIGSATTTVTVSNTDSRSVMDGVTTGPTTTATGALAAGSLPATSTTGPPAFAAAGDLNVTTATTPVILHYTSKDATHFLGVTVTNAGGTIASGGTISQGSATVTSATAHFCAAYVGNTCAGVTDVGKRISGASLPDGATIAAVTNANTAVIGCVGCLPTAAGAILGIQGGNTLSLSIQPTKQTSSTRFVSDAHFNSPTAICSVSAKFVSTDVGLAIATAPGAPAFTGATPANLRISTVTTGTCGGTLGAGSIANLTGGTLQAAADAVNVTHNIVVGVPEPTSPASGDVAAGLAIGLQVNPALNPTSPPCSAGKLSAFEVPLQWENPAQYDTTIAPSTSDKDFSFGLTQQTVPGTSSAQLLFKTSATSFAGFLYQGDSSRNRNTAADGHTSSTVTPTVVTSASAAFTQADVGAHIVSSVAGSLPKRAFITRVDNATTATLNTTATGTTAAAVFTIQNPYMVKFTFLPVGIGICPNTSEMQAIAAGGQAVRNAMSPTSSNVAGNGATSTGPAGNAQIRTLDGQAQGTSKVFTGTTGLQWSAFYVSGKPDANQPANSGSCTLTSPNVAGYPCGDG